MRRRKTDKCDRPRKRRKIPLTSSVCIYPSDPRIDHSVPIVPDDDEWMVDYKDSPDDYNQTGTFHNGPELNPRT